VTVLGAPLAELVEDDPGRTRPRQPRA